MRHPLLLSILAALPGCADTFVTDGCLVVDEGTTTCPAPSSVNLDELNFPNECRSDIEIVEVRGSGKLSPSAGKGLGSPACCYAVEVIDHEPNVHCVPGRPYFDRGRAQSVSVSLGVQTHADASRAHAWALAGAAEHASIAAFNRLSLQLMALGAPLELLGAVQQAALEEVQHAQACFELAQRFSGADVTHGIFPFTDTIEPRVTLAELAYAAVREGCLAETLGACVTASVAELTTDAQVQPVLRRLAEDEATHAVLSYRIVAWALQTGGVVVREAVAKALNEPWPQLDTLELARRSGLPQPLVEHALREAHNHVLNPSARALSLC